MSTAEGETRTVWSVTIATASEGPKKPPVELHEVAFDARRIETSLRKRFRHIWIYDPERSTPCEQTKRLHFVCQK